MAVPCAYLHDLQQLNVDDRDACHADIVQKRILVVLHIFKAARLGVTVERDHLPAPLQSFCNVGELGFHVSVDRVRQFILLMIFLIVDMVQLSSAWLSQQCTFFICSFPPVTLIHFCSLFGGK